MEQKTQWQKPDGKKITVPIEDEIRAVLEIHADINTNPQFKSNDALREAMGYIHGMGFAFRAKPHAFASSSCANKMVQ